MGLQLLPENLLLHGLLSRGHSSWQEPAPVWGPPWTAVWILALLWSSMGCMGTTCSGLQGNLCSGAWSASSRSFFSGLDDSRAVSLTFSYSSLSQQLCSIFFYPFLNIYHKGTTSLADGLSSRQWQVLFGAGWNCLGLTWGQFLVSSHRNHPCNTLRYKNLAL